MKILVLAWASGSVLASSPFACPAGIKGIENDGNCFGTRCCQDEGFRCFKAVGQKRVAICKPMSETCGPETGWLCPGTWEDKETRRAMWEKYHNARPPQIQSELHQTEPPVLLPQPPPTTPSLQQSKWAAIVTIILTLVCIAFHGGTIYGENRERHVRELLVFTCNPRDHDLPQAHREGNRIAEGYWKPNLFGAEGASLKTLRKELSKQPTRRFHFAGHSNLLTPKDVPGGVKHTLGFTTADGSLEFENAEKVVEVLTKHGKDLKFVFINGCESLDFGRALIKAGIPRVLCWKTIVEDSGASEFAVKFYEELWDGKEDYRAAYDAAKEHVEELKRNGTIEQTNGVPVEGYVQKYEFRARGSPSRINCKPKPIAVGCPVLLPDEKEHETERDGRTLTSEQQQEPPSPALSDVITVRGVRKRQNVSPFRSRDSRDES